MKADENRQKPSSDSFRNLIPRLFPLCEDAEEEAWERGCNFRPRLNEFYDSM